MKREIKQTWLFNQPPNEVWEYLTRSELIEQWLAKTDFLPVVGRQFQFVNNCEDASGKPNYTFWKVLEVVPYKVLSYSWQRGTTKKDIKIDSVVKWTLFDKDGGTELNLQHDGFKLLEDVMAHNAGWHECLKKITQLINHDSNAKPIA